MKIEQLAKLMNAAPVDVKVFAVQVARKLAELNREDFAALTEESQISIVRSAALSVLKELAAVRTKLSHDPAFRTAFQDEVYTLLTSGKK